MFLSKIIDIKETRESLNLCSADPGVNGDIKLLSDVPLSSGGQRELDVNV
jgi:hypothetical protein